VGCLQCLNRFNKRMSLSGGSLREESIFNTRELLKETFADDPSFTSGVYFWRLGLKEYQYESPIGIRLYGRSFSAANGVTVKFQTLHENPIIVGDIIYDTNEDAYLICTEAFNIDNIHYKGKFTLCNWMLKWQKKDGTILEYPCYDMNSTQYNSGEQSNTHFTIGSSQHMITLPSDENTIALSSPQRFYLDKNMDNPTSFIVTQNDTTSHNYGKKGLVKLTVYEYPNNTETDRPDLGICDYIDINAGYADEDICCCMASKAVIEHSTSVIKSGGDSQIFIGKFYDEKGNEVDGIVPHWTIVCDFSSKLQVKEFDNCLSIGIDDDSYIDEEFKLICSDGNNESEILSDALIIKIESLL
jgi:hypothetical protein